MIFFVFFAALLFVKLVEEFVPVVVVGTYARFVHFADSSRSLINSVGICGVVVLALTPGATARHFTVDALLRRLGKAVKSQERTQLVLVDTVGDITDDDRFFAAKRVSRESCARVENSICIYRKHSSRAAPVLVVINRVERLSYYLGEE